MIQDKVRIIVKGEDRTDSIRSWSQSSGKFHITFQNGKTYSYNESNVEIKRPVQPDGNTAHHRFEYLKQIAKTVGLQDQRSGNILANRYDKIDLTYEKSILSSFLTGKLHNQDQAKRSRVFYPFGFNLSQKKAIDKALGNTLSIIEGPPGTGKTQTILNIIANAIMRNESIAVVSSNNSATANILEKLHDHQVSFIAAYLGNTENKAKFIETQEQLPIMDSWLMSKEEKQSSYHSMYNLSITLSDMLKKKNELSRIRQELDALSTEYSHFCNYCPYTDKQINQYLRPAKSSVAAFELWLVIEKYVERAKMPGFVARIFNRFAHGVINKAFYSISPDMMIAICQRRWYIMRIAELTSSVSLLQATLDLHDFEQKMNEYSVLSLKLFQNFLAQKYPDGKRQQFSLEDMWKNSSSFIKEYPVILSTTYSLRSSLSSRVMYDYVIIDESSQVDIATGALALSCAKKAIIVGDLKQLPHIVDSDTARKTDEVFCSFDLPEAFRYKNHSLLLSAVELFPDAPRTLLREHYRCHPMIIGFCNQKFYDNQLITLTKSNSDRQPLVIYKTVPGNHAREHINQRQIDVIKNEIIPQQHLAKNTVSVGIVTPYRNQTNALQKAFSGTGILADTVDKFQGRENDVIILSTVDNVISEFTDNANRLNVAVSRAIEQLILVVSSSDDLIDKNIGDLVRYIEYNNLEVVQSEVHSIFDYLYATYRNLRIRLLCDLKKVSEYDSENLMHGLICKILGMDQFSIFGVAVHVPLRMILRNTDKLDNIEKQYAQNILTHVDFLVYEKIGKIPRLVIEVDGAAFHAEGTRQAERDRMKDGILEKYALPCVRFRTDESNEQERLVDALTRITAKRREW